MPSADASLDVEIGASRSAGGATIVATEDAIRRTALARFIAIALKIAADRRTGSAILGARAATLERIASGIATAAAAPNGRGFGAFRLPFLEAAVRFDRADTAH